MDEPYCAQCGGPCLRKPSHLEPITDPQLLTRPTADLGDDGELVERLRTPLSGSRTALVMEDGTWRDPLRLEAADRLILYREALADAQEQVGAYGYSTVHGRRVRQSWAAELLDKIDAVLSRSGG